MPWTYLDRKFSICDFIRQKGSLRLGILVMFIHFKLNKLWCYM